MKILLNFIISIRINILSISSVCTHFVVTCPALTLQNGEVIYQNGDAIGGWYPVDTSARFYCDEEYTQEGNSYSTCQESGHWNQQGPTCTYGNKLYINLLIFCFIVT